MIKYIAFLFVLDVRADSNLPSLATCTHESNYGYRSHNDSKIVGGIIAKENQWPFIVNLFHFVEVGNSVEIKGFCGGTVIDNYWVLT